jgi:hypothetical protein
MPRFQLEQTKTKRPGHWPGALAVVVITIKEPQFLVWGLGVVFLVTETKAGTLTLRSVRLF